MANFGLGTNYTGTVLVSEVATNVGANQSTVRVTVRVTKNSGSGYWNGSGSARSWSVTGVGATGSGSSSYDYRTSSGVDPGEYVQLIEYDRTITHATNGSGSVTASCSISHVDNPPGSGSGSQGLTLTDFPQPASTSFASSNVSVVSATIAATVSTHGNGTSSTQTFYLRVKNVGSYVSQGTGNSRSLTGLMPATTYQWYVVTTNNTGNTSGNQAVQEFTTLPAPANSTAMLRIIGVL